MVKHPPASQKMKETWVQSLGGEDLLEEKVAAHSSVLTRKIPWTDESGRPQPVGSQRLSMNAHMHTYKPALTPKLSIP